MKKVNLSNTRGTVVTFLAAVGAIIIYAGVRQDKPRKLDDRHKVAPYVLRDEDLRIEYKNHFQSFAGASALIMSASKYDVKLAGILSIRHFAAGPNTFWVNWSDVNLELLVDDQPNIELSRAVAAELANGFGLSTMPSGHEGALHVTPPSSAWAKMAEGIGLELVTGLSRPELPESGSGTIREQDALGRYTENVRFDPQSETLRKFDKVYVPEEISDIQDSREHPLLRPDCISSTTFHQYSQSGDFSTAEFGQQLELTEHSQKVFQAITEAIATRIVRVAGTVAQSQREVGGMVTLTRFNELGSEGRPKLPPADEVRDQFKRFDQIKDSREQTDIVLTAGRLMRHSSKDIPAFLALITNLNPNSVTYSGVLRALIYADTPEVQSALLAFIAAAIADGRPHTMLVAHLSEFSDPTAELLAALNRYASPTSGGALADNATLALGTLASHLAGNEDERSGEITRALLARYSHSKDLGEKSLLWGALGNTGSMEILPIAASEYAQAPVELRPRIINALRLVPGGDAQALILDSIEHGDTENIRAAGANALKYRKPSQAIVLSCMSALTTETSEPVLSSLISYLSRNRATYPEVTAFVEAALAKHPSIRI